MAGVGLASGLSGAGAAGYAFNIEPRQIVLQNCKIRISGLPPAFDGFKIALFSDLHLFPYTKLELVREAVNLVNSLQPDLAIIAGDFVYKQLAAVFDLVPVLSELNPRLGTLAVLGNHDHWKGAHVIVQALQKAGVRFLINDGIEIQRGSKSIFVAGIDSVWAGVPSPQAAFAKRRGKIPTILALHEPDGIAKISQNFPVDLQLSGHSHGGQVRLPLSGAIVLPPWGQKYDLGLYQVGESQLYTNRGIGVVGVPIRFNCPPEVTNIILCA
ncbi:MAG: metallophosphoesterase [Verrucomicrobia bacterium]|nr:metallophosphoesterase [Verrucomicrobiota bacterium]